MATVSSGLTLTSDFYLRNFYVNNRDATKITKRENYTKKELSYEDSRALSRAAKRLSSYYYSEDENEENIKNTIKAFAETYNNTLDSLTEIDDTELERYSKQLKALSNKFEDELNDVGITVEKDGKLSVNENLLKSADMDKIKEVFSKDSDFTKKTSQIAKRLNRNSYEAIYAELTGTGYQINITL